MSDISVFIDKAIEPPQQDVEDKLAGTYSLWQRIHDYVLEQYPEGKKEWNFPGKKYGWSFRIKDKKRAIIYFLPREGYFKVAFVFGQKATDAIMETSISDQIKTNLEQAKKYVEGRGVQIEVHDEEPLKDIEELVRIKLKF